MNKRPKELWLGWLAINRQTTGCLYDMNEEAYCCLGGLTQCYINETGRTWKEVEDKPIDGVYGLQECLSKEVAEWAGIDRDPTLIIKHATGTEAAPMTALNDDYGYTFQQLAELIKEQL